MIKKLTAQGPKDRKSYTVTLPIEWIKAEGLDKKKTVDLNVAGPKIIISSGEAPAEEFIIDGDSYENNLIKVLQGLFRVGVNEIRLSFSKHSVVNSAIDIIEQKLIGYEVIEQKKDHIVIKDITKESEEDFKVILRRVFLLILELSESDSVEQIESLHRNIKKLTNYCQRILMKKGHTDFNKVPLYFVLVDRLEKLADEYRWLLKIILPDTEKLPHLKELNQIFRNAYELFYKYDEKKYNDSQYRTYLIKNEIKDEIKVDKTTVHLHNLSRVLNSLYSDIFMLMYNEKVEI